MSVKKKFTPVVKSKPPMRFFIWNSQIIDLNNLKADDVHIEHIAHSLSNLCRYNGSCSRFYSVAEHCVRLSRYVIKQNPSSHYHNLLAKALFLHDAGEAFIGDVTFHLKAHMPQFIEMEKVIEEIIMTKYGLTQANLDMVGVELKELDRRISFDEMYYLFGRIDPWFYQNEIDPLGQDIMLTEQDRLGWTPTVAKEQFLLMAEFFGLHNSKVSEVTSD